MLFQNRDGTKTLYSYDYPVKYIDENGNIKDKSDELSSIPNKENYSLASEDNNIKTYYPSALSKENGVTLEYENVKIEMSPIAAKEKQYILSDGNKLNIAEYDTYKINSKNTLNTKTKSALKKSISNDLQIEESTLKEIREIEKPSKSAVTVEKEFLDVSRKPKDAVDYAGVFGENTSIRYSSTFEGFKEDIILKENTGVNKFTFKQKLTGLHL